jgi:hypothetical protein
MPRSTILGRVLDAIMTAIAVFFGLTPDPTHVAVVDDSYRESA